jgi:hypothetical protein
MSGPYGQDPEFVAVICLVAALVLAVTAIVEWVQRR